MIREKINQFLDELRREIEELDEAHTIITRKPWVLWNDREEEQEEVQLGILQKLKDIFRFLNDSHK